VLKDRAIRFLGRAQRILRLLAARFALAQLAARAVLLFGVLEHTRDPISDRRDRGALRGPLRRRRVALAAHHAHQCLAAPDPRGQATTTGARIGEHALRQQRGDIGRR